MNTAQLQIAVLQELGVLAAGESANAGDATIVDDKAAALYEMLLSEGLVSWAAEDDIPAFAERAVTWMVAFLCASPFGVPAEKYAQLQLQGALSLPPNKGGPSLAETQLRRQLAQNFVYYPQATEYF